MNLRLDSKLVICTFVKNEHQRFKTINAGSHRLFTCSFSGEFPYIEYTLSKHIPSSTLLISFKSHDSYLSGRQKSQSKWGGGDHREAVFLRLQKLFHSFFPLGRSQERHPTFFFFSRVFGYTGHSFLNSISNHTFLVSVGFLILSSPR